MRKLVVLGGGRVGGTIARDLAGEFDVTVVDRSAEALGPLAREGLATEEADLSDRSSLERHIAGADLVVGAVPGDLGFETARTVIEAGRPLVDISFFEQDPFGLDAMACERDVVAVVDCGIAPGWSNMVLGYLEARMDRVDRFRCYVGGLPVERRWPYEYAAVFSPLDVIAEYTRPARLVVGGDVVSRPALSEIELLDLPGVGTLEAFNTDGLRTLVETSECPDMREKTLRYPGHADRMRMLRDSGFFDKRPVELGETSIVPLDLTAKLLVDEWRLEPGEEDLTVMRVEVDGLDDGRPVRRTFDLLDRYDSETGTTSMARTTGFMCTAVVRLVAEGRYECPGISPPEFVGREPGCFEAVTRHLEERGVVFRDRTAPIAHSGPSGM